MNRRLRTLMPLVVGSLGIAMASLPVSSWAQLPQVPMPTAPVQDAVNTAQDATQRATDTARDATQPLNDAARQATESTRDAAQDVGRAARDAIRQGTQELRDTARDIQRGVNDARTPDARVRAQASQRTSVGFRGADLGIWFGGSTSNGLVISDIDTNAALGQVGFREGDRIVSVGGQQVLSEADFIRLLRAQGRGRTNVVVLRDGQQQTLDVDPLTWQEIGTVRIEPLEQFGVILDDRYTDRLVVWKVIPRSPAFYSGIRTGDAIVTFGGQSVATPAAFAQIVGRTNPGSVAIQVNRNGQTRTINADIPNLQTHTTYRQNLDAGANAQPNLNTPDVDAGGRVEAQTSPQRTNNNYRATPSRRGLFRRR